MTKYPIIEIEEGNKKYPKLLSFISCAPKKLYCRGNLDLLHSACFGVIGTRKITTYGKEAAETIVKDLVLNGFTIVSGLALGIDAASHRAALNNKGKTIAVLGSGIDDRAIMPQTNLGLAMDILDNDGLIVSEYPKGARATEFTFPARNRIISGLSLGVLIVEADERSGSLITAGFAADQGRDVFAVPGSIFAQKSCGANQLIQKGAKLVTSAKDIIDEYNQTKLPLFIKPAKAPKKSEIENKIIDILADKGSLFIEDIARDTKEEASKVMAALSIMEINGQIKDIGNGRYAIKK